jgi:ribonuclease P protein component
MRSGVPPSRGSHEANLSTQQQASEENARISGTHGHPRRTSRAQAASREGAEEADRVGAAEAAALTSSLESYPARFRLRQRSDFQRVERRGRRAAGKYFVVLTESRDHGDPRLGVTVSRRVGEAVVRNRVKRLVREVFRRRRSSLPTADSVVIARTGAGAIGYPEVAAELDQLWARLAR